MPVCFSLNVRASYRVPVSSGVLGSAGVVPAVKRGQPTESRGWLSLSLSIPVSRIRPHLRPVSRVARHDRSILFPFDLVICVTHPVSALPVVSSHIRAAHFFLPTALLRESSLSRVTHRAIALEFLNRAQEGLEIFASSHISGFAKRVKSA